MTKTHVTIISLLLAVAVVLSLAAAIRTTGLVGQQATTSASALEARQQRLDRLQVELRRALANRPPALLAAATTPRAVAPRVLFVTPTAVAPPRSSFEEHDDHGDDEQYEGFDD